MNIQFTLAARYLLGRKLRTVLTTLAIIFGVMIVFSLNGLIPAFAQTFRQNMLAAAGKVDLAVTGVTGGVFGLDVVETVRGLDSVAQATGLLRQNVNLPANASVSAITVAGIDPVTAPGVRPYTLVDGRYLEPGDGNAMVISQSLADTANLHTGDTITLPSATGSADFEVVGVISARALPGVEEVYVPLPAAQTLFNQPDRINTVEAVFTPDADRERVGTDAQARLGDRFKLSELESGSQFLASLQVGQIALNIFGLLALAMGAFVIFNTFRTIVAERRRDIGMLRAVGASRRTIMGAVLAESLLQAVVGTIGGLILGAALAYGLTALAAPIFQQYLHFSISQPLFTPVVFVICIVLGVGITVLGGLFPAISASRVSPLDALRPQVGEVVTRATGRSAKIGAALIVLAALALVSGNSRAAASGAFLMLIGLVLVAPALVKPLASTFGRLLAIAFAREGQIAEGNMARQPGRAAITASAMMIGLAIIIAFAGVLSSVQIGFLSYLDQSMGADFLLMPPSLVLGAGNVGAGPGLAQHIRETDGVDEVTTLRLANSEAKGVFLQLVGIDPATYPVVSGLAFVEGESVQAYSALEGERAIVVNGIFASQANVKVGDMLTLTTPQGDLAYRVVGIGLDYLNAKVVTGYISQANMAADFHESNDLLLMVNTVPGADLTAVRDTLRRVIKDYPAFTLLESAEWRSSQTETFTKIVGALYFLMIALSIPSLIALVNTLAINVIERTREIGMIRAVGGTRRQIRRMILAESLLLSAMGIAFGILAGLWLGYALVSAMSVAGFLLSYSFPLASILVAIAVGLIFGVLASLLPARQAARLDIVAALRYE